MQEIFNLYLSGVSRDEIAHILNRKGIQPLRGKMWQYSTVKYVLTNEKYAGNALLQKYVKRKMPHEIRKRNHGEYQQYFCQNIYPAIISQECFERAQLLARARDPRTDSRSAHYFNGKIVCCDCGHSYRFINRDGKPFWTCSYPTKEGSGCKRIWVSEIVIKSAFLNLAGKLYTYQEELFSTPIKMLREIAYNGRGEDRKLMELNEQIAVLNDKSASLQKLNSKGFIDAEEYRRQNETLAVQRRKLNQERKKKLQGNRAMEMVEAIEEFQNQIGSWPEIPTIFSIELFDSIVEKIIPMDKNTLKFKLHCGLEFTEVIS